MSQRALLPALTRARDAHIPVVLINTPIPQENLFTAFVGDNSELRGATAATVMANALKNRLPAKVAVIAGGMDEGIAPARIAGFKKEMEKHPRISVVAVEATHWAPPEAERDAGQLLARFPGLDGIYAMNDALANGDPFVDTLVQRQITPVIPPKVNREVPRPCDFALYCERNLVERFFSLLRHFRAIATRYDKLARNFLAGIQLAAVTILLD